jgi:hypothetical protein
MKRLFFLIYILLLINNLQAQEISAQRIELNQYSKDERFDKFQITLALFELKKDSILSMNFEDLKPAIPIYVKKPNAYRTYAYGYLFFNGSSNSYNKGYVSVLVCNPYHKNPHLIVDQNQNFDFTDDSTYQLPYFDEPPLTFHLKNEQFPEGKIKIKLSRQVLTGRHDFKQFMNEYFAQTYKDRTFIGIEFTYREQRYITKSGIFKSAEDSFQVALYDANSDGIYNTPNTDKLLINDLEDSIFDATNPLKFELITNHKQFVFEKNGMVYQVIKIDSSGNSLQILPLKNSDGIGKIAIGKKVPNLALHLSNGERLKLRKLRKKEVYLYFSQLDAKNFKTDTFILRQLASLDSNQLKVICVLYSKNSYELKIFQDFVKPNYLLAYGTKNMSEKLGIKSIPQSLFLGKRRKVKFYGKKPQDFMRYYLQNNP